MIHEIQLFHKDPDPQPGEEKAWKPFLNNTVLEFTFIFGGQQRNTNEWIKKLWYIYTMEYYSAIKR